MLWVRFSKLVVAAATIIVIAIVIIISIPNYGRAWLILSLASCVRYNIGRTVLHEAQTDRNWIEGAFRSSRVFFIKVGSRV